MDSLTPSLRHLGIELFEERAALHPDAAFLGYGFRTQHAEIVYRVDEDTVWVVTYKRISPEGGPVKGFQSFFWFLTHIIDHCPEVHFVEGMVQDHVQAPGSLPLKRIYRFYHEILNSEPHCLPDGSPYLRLDLRRVRSGNQVGLWRRRARYAPCCKEKSI